MKANVERAMQDAVVSLQTSIPGQTSLLTENQVIEQTVMAPPSNPVDDLNLSEKIQHHIDSKNWSRPATPEEINDALLVKSSPTASISQLMEQKSEQMTQHEQKILEHHDEYCKRKLLLCMHLEESEIGGSHGRFLLTGVGDQLQDKERILVRSRRAELAVSASKEKLTILNNIYSAVQQWEYTLWACANKQAWNPGLVFATIEAAKVSNKEVNKILGTIDSDLRLLICCEAICELTHAFPPECLLPTRFVEERLLAATSDRSNVQDWVTRSLLKEYQDIESQMFWDSLTRYAIYLVTQELATAKQIASVFTGILLPVPRLKDTTKDAVEHARATLHIFISTLLGKKAADVGANDTSAICLSQVKTPCTSDSRAWHQNKEVAVYKQESHGTEDKDSGLLPLVEIPMLYAEEDAMEELSSNASKSRRAPSCLSCVMLMKCLPWKKSKL
ncbi:hypothetical protein KP509_1Z025300 [Ceratopteris richardii]|nr:hypothetical protein KP509_1Z025300 [Ceratopteris richardii]